MFAYVPARIGSKRIPRKNVRPLAGRPVIEYVLEELGKVGTLDGIAVSTDSNELRERLSTFPKVVCLEPRNAELASDTAGFLDLVRHDMPRFHRHFGSSTVLITTPTAALVRASHYRDAIHTFERNQNRGLTLGVVPYAPSAYLALVRENNAIVPLFPEAYRNPTQSLAPTFHDCGCFYLLNLEQVGATPGMKSFFDLAPVSMVELPSNCGIDVDNEEDWVRLEEAFAKVQK